jgi:hypothetical protein
VLESIRLRKFFVRCILGQLERPLPVSSIANAAPTASRRPAPARSIGYRLRNPPLASIASSKPHTLPSGLAPTRSPVLQKSCCVGGYRTSRRYQRTCQRLIPRTLHQASGSSRSAALQIESRVTSRNGRARPRHGRRPRDLGCQGRPRPHDTRPCVDLRKTGRRGATRRQSHRPPPVRARNLELDR